MYLPRNLISHLYNHLVKTTHQLSPAVQILVSLNPDTLCACHILTALLKRAYIQHKITPIAGYTELAQAGQNLIRPLSKQHGGEGGVVICLGVGALVDLEEVLGLDQSEDDPAETQQDHGIQIWVIDGRRPWNLQNVFGGGLSPTAVVDDAPDRPQPRRLRGVENGRILSNYVPTAGGVIVFDDGDIEHELTAEGEAFCALQDMPDIDDDNDLDDASDTDDDNESGHDAPTKTDSRKRKTGSEDRDDDLDSESESERPRQRRKSNSVSPHSPSRGRESDARGFHTPVDQSQDDVLVSQHNHAQPASSGSLRRRLLRLRRKHEATLQAYYALGTSYSESISTMMYNLAGDLGIYDKEILWHAIVGISSLDLYGTQTDSKSIRRPGVPPTTRQEQVRQLLREDVRRFCPLPDEVYRERELGSSGGVIPTSASSPSDNAIRLSPEPRFLLIRHWSLYDSMFHSPYLSCRLHVWSDAGRKRLDRLLAEMGISCDEANKGYTHMDIELKRGLRQRLLKYAPRKGLDDLVPPSDTDSHDKQGWGFVRCWGWKACLSAVDVAVIVGAILEVGADVAQVDASASSYDRRHPDKMVMRPGSYHHTRVRALPTPEASPSNTEDGSSQASDPDWTTNRFFAAYDALSSTPSGLSKLMTHLETAKSLHRAILYTGCALIGKHQIRHLRAFRMGVVREGPHVALFLHPGALVKLAGWVMEAVGVIEAEKGAKDRGALVLGALDEDRGVYLVVGLGGSSAAHPRVRSRAEQKEREAKLRLREERRVARRAQRVRVRAEKKRRKRERDEANGIFADDDEDEDESEDSASESEDSEDSDEEDEATIVKRSRRGFGLNKFGTAFQQVVEETGARVRIDSFEHSVVEVQKEDFSGFLEALSTKDVIG